MASVDQDLESGSSYGADGVNSKRLEDAVLERFRFVSRVYAVLLAQVALTVIIVCSCMYVASTRNFLVTHRLGCYLGFAFGSTALLMLSLSSIKKRFPLNLLLLGVFTVFEGLFLGVVGALLYENGEAKAMLQAFLVTIGVFLSLSIFAWQSRIDFGFLRAFLFCALMLLLFWGFFSLTFGLRTGFAYSLIGSLVFCLFILFDTWRLSQKEEYHGDYISASIALYLDLSICSCSCWIWHCVTIAAETTTMTAAAKCKFKCGI